MAVRTIEGTRVRARHHQHHDGRAAVTLSWATPAYKVQMDLQFPGGKTEQAFNAEFESGKLDAVIADVASLLTGATE